MFLGQYEHTIDEKGRLAIPIRFRGELSDGLYLTAGVDRCLYILTHASWQTTAEAVANLPWLNPDARQIQRHLFALATHLVPDRLGRVVVPQYLRNYAALTNDVVVAGLSNRIEVWDRTAWEGLQADFIERGPERATALLEFMGRPTGGA